MYMYVCVHVRGVLFSSPTPLQQLTGQQATPDHAASLLDKFFATAHKTTTVLLADEVGGA